MTDTLEGTVALVTGASSGIGEATAVELARAGAKVAVLARRTDRLAGLAQRIGDGGGEAFALECDVTDESSIAAGIQATVQHFGRLDTVVANAGTMLLGQIEGAPLDEWERMVDLNVKGVLYTAHSVLPHLLAAASDGPRQVADLILVSSVAGRWPRSGSGVYNLTKFGIGAFAESLRQEVTRRHVRVSLVEPGATISELTTHMSDAAQARSNARFAEMERLTSDDIADAIGYIVTRPRRMAINEILIRPTEQEQ